MPIELVIFDFDGTLVDTAPDLVRATNICLEANGKEPLPEARIRGEIGMGLLRLITQLNPEKLRPEQQHSLIESFTKIYEQEFLKSPTLFEGAEEFLQEWHGQIAIVSNKRSRFIHPILEKLDLNRFPWAKIVGGDTFKTMKPHPEPFLEAMQAAGVRPEETLIVGDGIPDVEGAKNVGSLCLAVEFGYTPYEQLLELGAWKTLPSFADLKPIIATIT